jgi:hypothetical protein
VILVIQSETIWIRDSLVSNMTHLGPRQQFEAGGKSISQDSWSKTQLASSAMIERRMSMVNQGPGQPPQPNDSSSLNAAASEQPIFNRERQENGIMGSIWVN